MSSKLVEMVENVQNFSDAWDAAHKIYDSKKHDFDFVRVNGGWSCHVIKVTTKLDGKEVKYVRSFVLKEFGENMETAFRNAALKYLKK